MPELVKPELPEFYSPGRVFLSAFATYAAINARRTQLENQLQHLQLQNEAMQYRQQQNEASFGLRQQAMENQYNLGIQKIGIDRDRLANQTEATILQRRQDAITDGRVTEFQSKAAQISDKIGTQGFDTSWNILKSEYSDILGEPGAASTKVSIDSRHSRAVGESVKAKVNLQKDYKDSVGALGVSDPNMKPGMVDYFFNNPNIWYTRGGKAAIDYDSSGRPVPEGAKTKAGSFTIGKNDYDTMLAKRKAAFPSSPSDTPAIQALPNGMKSGTTATSQYKVGGQYGNLIYKGGDVNDQNSWQPAQ
jgi:hypothetical protein